MGLFLDGNTSTIADLQRYESSILDVASTEGVDLDVKLDLAQEELTIEIEAMINRPAAGSNTGVPGLDQIAATPALRQWHRMHTLALVFRDCYHSELNDRYEAKWKEYATLAEQARDRLVDIGIGYVTQPLARPAAPTVRANAGTQAAGTFYVEITCVNRQGEESAASDPVVTTTTDNTQLGVGVSNLPYLAVGWNVYVGASDDDISRQNSAPLAPSDAWQMPAYGLVAGAAIPAGQEPNAYLRYARSFQRG